MHLLTERTTVIDDLGFPEDPRWHDGALWFSDMRAKRVARWVPGGAVETVFEMEDCPSGLGWLPDGTLLVVGMYEEKLWRWTGGALALHADLAPFAGHGVNDMAVDARGYAWITQFGSSFSGETGYTRQTSPVLLVRPDGSVAPAGEPILLGNGIRLVPGTDRLIVAESAGLRLSRFRVGEDGLLGDRQIVSLPEGHSPDGICLDSGGGTWAACLSRGVIRIDADGTLTHAVPVEEGRAAYACMFGGTGLDTLFVCTAEMVRPGQTRAGMIAGGRIEAVTGTGFTGVSTD